MKNNDDKKFYAEILQAVQGYVSDKLSIPVSELTKENIKEKLVAVGIENSETENITDLLNTCEYAQFAPTDEESAPENIYKKASEIITNLEKQI